MRPLIKINNLYHELSVSSIFFSVFILYPFYCISTFALWMFMFTLNIILNRVIFVFSFFLFLFYTATLFMKNNILKNAAISKWNINCWKLLKSCEKINHHQKKSVFQEQMTEFTLNYFKLLWTLNYWNLRKIRKKLLFFLYFTLVQTRSGFEFFFLFQVEWRLIAACLKFLLPCRALNLVCGWGAA